MTAQNVFEGPWEGIDEEVRDKIAGLLDIANVPSQSDIMGRLDPMALYPAMTKTAMALAKSPNTLWDISARWSTAVFRASTAATLRAFGADAGGPEPARDKRFADPAWKQHAGYWLLRQNYLAWQQAVTELVEAADVPADVKRKVAFLSQSVVDSLAPTNFAAVNPAVIKRALESGGTSLVRGARNFLTDLATNEGQPRQVATGVHEVGRDLAVTPGKVVYRNNLMELLQYTPTTDTVHEIPLLLSPPWINKYYVMDLSPGRSLVQWAVDHGHTVFMLSYRNPDESMRDVKLDDYLLSGPLEALDVIEDITGSKKVNLLGLCLGGTLTMALLAYLDATGQDRVNSATFLNTLIDFSDPGALGVFTDEATVSKLEVDMQKTGFLSSESMRRTFDLLRGNDLIWNYVVSNWMLGEDPPAFDILTWNLDATRMPANMHSFYLRSCYLKNQLALGQMELAGQKLDLGTVDQDLYFLAAEQDHIAPWRSSYKGALLPKGDVRFVLSNAGHIAGIVNPPNPKSLHRVVETTGELPADPDAWLAASTTHPITWWEDWATWIGERAGKMRKPPTTGNSHHPALTDAPGTYVLEA